MNVHCNEFICFTTYKIPFLYPIFQTVLVHSGCYNKNTVNWVVYKQQTFLIVLEAGSPRSQHWQIHCLVRLTF